MRKLAAAVGAALVAGAMAIGTPPASAVSPPDYTAWVDLGIVYTAPSGDAYYPSVIYDPGGFGVTAGPRYKMWYSDGAGSVFVVSSTDGASWSAPTTTAGLGGDAHHVQVAYDASAFGVTGGPKYKMWYWDTDANLYSIDALAYAKSSDGVIWTDGPAITQDSTSPLVTGAGSGWNRGSYGPIDVLYRPGAPNLGTDPWDYSYVMYYDGTDGSREFTGLAYSSDGKAWTAYGGTQPVLDGSSTAAWDCSDAAYGTVYKDANGYHFWYSGGGANDGSGGCADQPVHQGIGYASSTDGKTWTKDPNNPIFHIADGVSYRNERVYTPAVVDDGSGFLKMYYSAKGSGGQKQIGLAVLPVAAKQWVTGGGWINSPPGATGFVPSWYQGFETDTAGWFDFGDGTVTRVLSGFTDTYASGIDSASGDYHARLGTTGTYDCAPPFSQSTACVGPFTRWGKTTSANPTFPAGGYRTEVDVYLDTAWADTADANPDWRFDFSSAINRSSDGLHLRDFAFNFGTDPGGAAAFVVNASTNAFRSSSYPSNPCPSPSGAPNACRMPVEISTSGWYTLRHTFRDDGGMLAVDMEILDTSGATVADWTIFPGDAISDVGGNRYGWFANQEIPNLAIDNATLYLPGPTGNANFGFVVKYQKNASTPGGNLLFQFQAADLNLKSSSFDWLVVAGPLASFQGTGTVNGVPGHRFKVDAKDGDLAGGQPDHLKMKIWNPSGGMIYQADEDLAGGSITVHAK